MPLKLFHRSEVFPAERAACDDNFVLRIHERREVVLPDFGLKGAEQFGFLHALASVADSDYIR